MTSNQVFAECFIDTLLASLVSGHSATHRQTNAELGKAMEKTKGTMPVIGFTDWDKKLNEVPYLPEFTEEKASWSTTHGRISLMKHPDKPHYLVFCQPDADYVVADLINEHTDRTYKVDRIKSAKRTITDEPEFKALVNTLVQKKASPLSELKAKVAELLAQ